MPPSDALVLRRRLDTLERHADVRGVMRAIDSSLGGRPLAPRHYAAAGASVTGCILELPRQVSEAVRTLFYEVLCEIDDAGDALPHAWWYENGARVHTVLVAAVVLERCLVSLGGFCPQVVVAPGIAGNERPLPAPYVRVYDVFAAREADAEGRAAHATAYAEMCARNAVYTHLYASKPDDAEQERGQKRARAREGRSDAFE